MCLKKLFVFLALTVGVGTGALGNDAALTWGSGTLVKIPANGILTVSGVPSSQSGTSAYFIVTYDSCPSNYKDCPVQGIIAYPYNGIPGVQFSNPVVPRSYQNAYICHYQEPNHDCVFVIKNATITSGSYNFEFVNRNAYQAAYVVQRPVSSP